MKFRAETNKPVVAFMQTIAASGGYYASVACDKIVAEPTVITGSIGVMLNHLVLKELFEDVVENPDLNNREALLELAKKRYL